MLLVDALYLNSPGGINLLKYFYENLAQQGISSFFLLDHRTEKELSCNFGAEKTFLKSSIINRKQFYLNHKNDFSSVLCFSNIPPPISLTVPVFTLFHNILLIQDCSYYPNKSRILFFLKRQYIFYHRNNSNTWIVQTGFMKQLLIRKLRIPGKHIEVLPFFCLTDPIVPFAATKKTESFIYPSTGVAHKNHIILLKAWELLYEEGYQFELHLTIPDEDVKLIKLIFALKSKGLNIINHGIIGQSELLNLYQSTEYLVYPSLNESFGLPLIEAIEQHCKVIVADMPYSAETIKPTVKFNPYQPSSIKNAILEATLQKENGIKSEILAENKIDLFINLLTRNSFGS